MQQFRIILTPAGRPAKVTNRPSRGRSQKRCNGTCSDRTHDGKGNDHLQGKKDDEIRPFKYERIYVATCFADLYEPAIAHEIPIPPR